tara:strand:+ start:182 stop:649 length:468 start_codon:yes stop_codon:yes gene_type:complete
MKSIIQIHLEYEKDVIRDIEINSASTLEELHYAIINSIGLEGNELASFYTTNSELETLQEIPLFNINKQEELTEMKNIIISSIFKNQGDELIYIYDFMKLWRFLVTLKKEEKISPSKVKCINIIGEMPKNAPKILFEKEETDTFQDEFDEFKRYE